MISAGAKAFALTQEDDEKILSVCTDTIIRRLPCFYQSSQLPGFGAGTVNRVIRFPGIKKTLHTGNIKDGKPGNIRHANRTPSPAFVFNFDSHRQPPMLIR